MARITTALRLTEELKANLERSAEMNHRSFNAEVVFRLEQSIRRDALEIGPSSASLGQTSEIEAAHEQHSESKTT
jgi:hypothetical protein